MNAPAPTQPGEPAPRHGDLLLDAAAKLLESRMVAIRSGSPVQHPLQELELAARAIRQLASDLERLQETRSPSDAGGSGPVSPVRPGRRGPPVLQRANRRPDAQPAPATSVGG